MFRTIIHMRNVAALVAVGVAGVAGASAYAFTASNTVPAHSAGVGQAAVSGFTASNIGYTYSGDGTTVTAVSFQTATQPNSVQVALTNTGTTAQGDWSSCGSITGSGPYTVSCTLGTPVAVGQDNYLSIAADSSGTVTIGP